MKKIFVSLVTALYLTVSTGVAPLLAATIVIDPGHGGTDGGASYYGLKEKDLNLAISQRLKALLEADNHEVVMTRAGDETLTLKQRVDIINGAEAQFYVAVHNNANSNTGVSGTQTYYYDINDPKANPSKYPPSQAAKDNSALNKEAAKLIQQGMLASMGTMDRGYLAGNLYVNRLANIPGALVEVAFISNPKDAEKLQDLAFLDKAAQGIKDGIDKFLSQNPSSGGSASFSDIGTSWARADIKVLAEHGIVQGEKGKFYPQRQITRAELATLLVRALGTQVQLPGQQDPNVDMAFQPQVEPGQTVTESVYNEQQSEGVFSDVSPEFWGYKDIMTAQKYGLVGGYKDGTFKPNAVVTRAEVSTMIARYLDIVEKLRPQYAALDTTKTVTTEGIKVEPAYNEDGATQGYQVGFADVGAHWAKAEILQLATLGIVGGYEDGTFKPKASATRAEIAAVIKRAMEHTGGLN